MIFSTENPTKPTPLTRLIYGVKTLKIASYYIYLSPSYLLKLVFIEQPLKLRHLKHTLGDQS